VARKIVCEWKEAGRALVNPDGQVWPCCYLCNGAYKKQQLDRIDVLDITEWDMDGTHAMRQEYVMFQYWKNKDRYNVYNQSISEVLEGDWFTKVLPASWEDPEFTLQACERNCSVEVSD